MTPLTYATAKRRAVVEAASVAVALGADTWSAVAETLGVSRRVLQSWRLVWPELGALLPARKMQRRTASNGGEK